MTDNMKRVLEKAIAHYGKSHQAIKCIEEIGEFLQALSKYTFVGDKHAEWKKTAMNRPATVEDMLFFEEVMQEERHLQEEIADAIIMLQQMRLIYGPERVDWWINFKLDRLEREIDNA